MLILVGNFTTLVNFSFMPAGQKFGGRSKGVPNKKTAEEIDRAKKIMLIIEDNFLEDDLDAISPRDRMNLYSSLLEYVQPKLARTEIKGEIEVSGGVQIYLPDNNRDATELQK